MARKCFISFKTEDFSFKKAIQDSPFVSIIDKSLNEPINSYNEDYIMQKIRNEYLWDSTVTIFLIGSQSAETLGYENQKYIKAELRASLYDSPECGRSGILGIVLPHMDKFIYQGNQACQGNCNNMIRILNMGDNTVIKEFHHNYHIDNNKCHWNEEDRYCVLAKWEEFMQNPNSYIEQAFLKRTEPIANKVRVRF